MDRRQGESATIYQFPAGGRAGKAGQRDAQRKAIESVAARYQLSEFGSGCYHEAAIQDEQAKRRQPR